MAVICYSYMVVVKVKSKLKNEARDFLIEFVIASKFEIKEGW
jgi:hypothetical protein